MTDAAVITLRELGGTLCRCGCKKRKHRTFCARCDERLPDEMRREVYKQLAEGRLDAYAAAVAYLKTNGGRRIKGHGLPD